MDVLGGASYWNAKVAHDKRATASRAQAEEAAKQRAALPRYMDDAKRSAHGITMGYVTEAEDHEAQAAERLRLRQVRAMLNVTLGGKNMQ